MNQEIQGDLSDNLRAPAVGEGEPLVVVALDTVLAPRVPAVSGLPLGVGLASLFGKAVITVSFWLVVGMAAAVIGRSTVVGLAGRFGYLRADAFLSQTFAWARPISVVLRAARLYPAQVRPAFGAVTSALWFEGYPDGVLAGVWPAVVVLLGLGTVF